ncbi:MAG: PocR ligand-binding domain-containing protein [Desulfobacterales bacterium]
MSISFSDLFDLKEIQKLQDAFAKAVGIASIITDPDGCPITEPSNFCKLCNDIIRKTEKGLVNCMKSDAEIGHYNPDGPTIRPCLSGGLWDAGASILAGNTHIANWLIGQVRDEAQSTEKMMKYARNIGADEEEFRSAWEEVSVMSFERFKEIANALFLMANLMSRTAYQNMKQKELTEKLEQEIAERETVQLMEEKRERSEKYMIFSSGSEEYGINISKIQEVIETTHVISVPETPDFIKGVINLRGKVIPVIDFRAKLGLKAVKQTERICIIIIDTQGQPMGITVDSIIGVSNVKGRDIENMPITGSKLKTGCILGLAKSEGKLKLLLDIDHFLDSKEADMLSRQTGKAA